LYVPPNKDFASKSSPLSAKYFDEGTWYAMCDFITVNDKDDIRVTFHNGMEIRV